MKSTSAILTGLLCLTLIVPAYCQRPRHAKKREPQIVQPAGPVAPTPPPTLAQVPAAAPRVAFQSGELTILADNSTLGDILKAVQSQTGAQVDFPGSATERVVGHFGPGPARDVLTSLLNGSHFNYLLLGSPTDPNALDRVILMAKSSGSVETSPSPPVEQANTYNQPVYARPMPAPMNVQGANTVVVEGQDAQDDSATDDSADTTDDAQADDQTDQTDDQTTDDQATDETQQQQQDGQQGVKTPEQLLQELQRQQQIQQQGAQPGVQPGLPTPGFPPGIQPGQQPPHNE